MKPERNLDRALEEFMDAGPESIPRPVLEDALEQVERTVQRPGVVAGVETNQLWLALPAVAAAAVLIAAFIVGPWAGPRVASPDASTSPTASPEASPTLPAATVVVPDAVIDVPGAFLTLADGEDRVWLTSDEALVAIDTTTGATTSFAVPVPAGSWAGLQLLDGSLWIGNYDEGVVYRVSRETGEIEAEIPVGSEAASLTAAGGGMWVRTRNALNWEAQRIDPATNRVVTTVEGGNAMAQGHGSLWFSQRGTNRIIRADPVTGEATAVIEVPPDHDCGISSSAEAVWASCLSPDRVIGSVVRIDPATDEAAVVHTGAAGGGAFDAGGRTWLAATSPDGGVFMSVNLSSNSVEQILLVGPDFNPDNVVIAGDSAWVANDSADEVFRFAQDVFAGGG